LDDKYFTQGLLPDYVSEFKPDWADKVMYDERGHFREPHTDHEIGLGTAAVRDYIDRLSDPELQEKFKVKVKTTGPKHRFGAVLFVEKEGFDALFEQVQIAERYDLAFMSCKGISVTAARELADRMCAEYDIPLFLLTDFDKSGFVGAGTFQKDNRRYTFGNEFEVIHIGLRLKDIQRLGIEARAEDSFDKGKPEAIRANLETNGATKAEIEFLMTPLPGSAAPGKRIELNALTSAELVALVERGLRANGIRKIVPPKDNLAAAYRLFKRGAMIAQEVKARIEQLNGSKVAIPADLEKSVCGYC
jgi:hypothetical protein